jgi:hypothetical protein
MPSRRDLCSKDGAHWLAREIEHYWRQRGSEAIEVWVQPGQRVNHGENGKMGIRHDVRSNMVNGFPPDWTQEMGT